MKYLIAPLAFVVLSIGSVTAKEQNTATYSKFMVFDDLMSAALKEMQVRENRTALVTSTRKYCDEVRRQFPTNSPSEETWLQTEMDGGTDRQLRAISSAEFGRAKAREFTVLCDAYVSGFEKGNGRKHNLVGIGHTFIRFSKDADSYASANKVNAKALGFPFLSFFAERILEAALNETE